MANSARSHTALIWLGVVGLLLAGVLGEAKAVEKVAVQLPSTHQFELAGLYAAQFIKADVMALGYMNPRRWHKIADTLVQLGLAKDTRRLEGFVSTELREPPHPWVWWLACAALAAFAVTALVLLANWRLGRLVERRTRELRESEARYRELFEASPNPMWIYDPETLRFLVVNDAAIERYGYSREEFLRMSIMDIRPPEEAERLRPLLPAMRPGMKQKDVWKHRKKSGEIILVEASAHILTLNGRRAVVAVPFDVTEIRRAEAALRESEARHRQLFENAVEGIYRSAVDGRFISVNPALAHMLGFATPAALLAAFAERSAAAALYVKPGRLDEFFAALGARAAVTDFDSEVRCHDGTTKWISENVRAVRDATGRLLYLEGFVSDITPRRRLEAEWMRASKLEAVGVLAGGIAHDFNNILTVVLGNLRLAELDTGVQAGPQLREAKRATLRARDLTQQLLTFAKGGDPVRTTVALPELVRESAEFALHGASSRAEFAFASNLWLVSADKGQLGQVVHNLVLNAVQAMPAGGVVRLGAVNACVAAGEVAALSAGDYVKISVADSGVGIAAEHLSKIFDPYFTTKQQGSGLGLAAVYSIVKKHQGHIEAESRLGAGTTFHVWLPAARKPLSAAPFEPKDAAPLRARVLFMDDEKPIRAMALESLARLGADCETAADGAEAVDKYRAASAAGRPFDAVILDLTVPGGMGGREALEQLRLFDAGVRAIVSSGYSRDPVLAKHGAYGFCGILPKPYGLEQLRGALREALAPPTVDGNRTGDAGRRPGAVGEAVINP